MIKEVLFACATWVVISSASFASCPSWVCIVSPVPKLGDKMPDYSGQALGYYGEVSINGFLYPGGRGMSICSEGILYDVMLDPEGRYLFISTVDPDFLTPEGISIADIYSDAIRKDSSSVTRSAGCFAVIVALSSGWFAGFQPPIECYDASTPIECYLMGELWQQTENPFP